MTQQQLAYHLGIGQATISGWLHGTIPQPRMLKALADTLQVDEHWLLSGTGKPFNADDVRERVRRAFALPPADYRAAFEALVGGMTEEELKQHVSRMVQDDRHAEAQVLLNYLNSLHPSAKVLLAAEGRSAYRITRRKEKKP